MRATSPAARAVGVDIGGTKVLGALVDAGGRVRRETRARSPAAWPELRDTVVEIVTGLRASEPSAEAVGIGAAGMVDHDGTVHYAPNVPGFRMVPMRAELEAALGAPVVIDNDANAAAYAEVQIGAARGVRDALVVTLGTGIGGGIVTGGRVMRGARGFAAEIGHFQVDPGGPVCACGERGHWEATASGHALGRLAREAAAAGTAPSVLEAAGNDVAAVTGEHVSTAAGAGAPDALAIVDRYALNVAIGLVGLANVLDPAVIVVAGGLVSDGDLFLDPIRRHFLGHLEGTAYRQTPPVVAAHLGERAGAVGAALLALGARG